QLLLKALQGWIVGAPVRQRLVELNPCGRPQAVNAQASRNLAHPGADCVVAIESVDVLIGARKHFLEDIFSARVVEPIAPDRDRTYVAGETLNRFGPGHLVASSTALQHGSAPATASRKGGAGGQ